MRIALDVMGGDYAPKEIIQGALEAIRDYSYLEKIFLVGQETKIKEYLHKSDRKIEIINATEIIGMDEQPASAYRRKKDASITVATKMVKNDEADAIVSAGSTGVQMISALFGLGRIKGVNRPAIGTVLPTITGGKLLLDAGANADCKANNLAQFALMGSVYAEKVMKINRPRIALVNIGAEKAKGNELSIKTYEILEQLKSINFIGNIEGRDIPRGKADVFVCDGFVGNIILKLAEGMAFSFGDMLKEEISKSIRTKIGAGIMLPALNGFKARLDYAEYGGAPLLGIDGLSIICHGSSKAKAIKNALRVAYECHSNNFVETLKVNLQMELFNDEG